MSCIKTCFFVVTSLAFHSYAIAQGTEEIEEIVVLGETYRNTATKTSLLDEETPQSINIISGELLDLRGVKSLNQALRYTPGVVTEQKGSAVTMYDTFNIRGFDTQQSYYDGLILQYLTGWNLQPQIDPISIQQIEVFKGPTSVLYGAMPPGGMINMIAKSPQSFSETDLKFEVGSRNLVSGSIDSTGPIGNTDANYRVIGLARSQDGQVDYTSEERYVVSASIDWNVTDDLLISFNGYYQDDPDMGMNSALPASGMIFSNPAGSTSPSTFPGDVNWSGFERHFSMFGYKINYNINDNWVFLQSLRSLNADLYQQNTYHNCYEYLGVSYCDFDANTGDLTRSVYSTDEESTGLVIDNQFSADYGIGDSQHSLLLGLDYQHLDGSSVYTDFGQVFGFNIFNPDNDLIDPSQLPDGFRYADDITVEQTGVYIQDQITIDEWTIIAGGRYDYYKSTSDYVGYLTEVDQNEFSYRIGMLYEFDSGVSPYLNYATSFEPKAGVDDVTGGPFKPEEAEQIEIGLKYYADSGTSAVTVSLYDIKKSNLVVSTPDNFLDSTQVGKARSKGLEFEGWVEIIPSFTLAASYTYSDVEITNDNGGELEGTRPIYSPEHMANATLNYVADSKSLEGLTMLLGTRYVGTMEMNALNTQGEVPDYVIVDFTISYDFSRFTNWFEDAGVNLIVNNVFNEESYTCYDVYNCWYNAERTIEFDVNFRF